MVVKLRSFEYDVGFASRWGLNVGSALKSSGDVIALGQTGTRERETRVDIRGFIV